MSKEVKRYGMCGFESGIVEMEGGPYVDSDDYEALLAERDRLREALKLCLTQLDAEYMPSDESATAIRLARAALQGEQP